MDKIQLFSSLIQYSLKKKAKPNTEVTIALRQAMETKMNLFQVLKKKGLETRADA